MIVSISLRESRQGSGVCVHMPFVLTISNEENLQIRLLCQCSLLEWSRCWGFTNCSSPSEFMFSLSLVS